MRVKTLEKAKRTNLEFKTDFRRFSGSLFRFSIKQLLRPATKTLNIFARVNYVCLFVWALADCKLQSGNRKYVFLEARETA